MHVLGRLEFRAVLVSNEEGDPQRVIICAKEHAPKLEKLAGLFGVLAVLPVEEHWSARVVRALDGSRFPDAYPDKERREVTGKEP